jgi:hypothetical protein
MAVSQIVLNYSVFRKLTDVILNIKLDQLIEKEEK